MLARGLSLGKDRSPRFIMTRHFGLGPYGFDPEPFACHGQR